VTDHPSGATIAVVDDDPGILKSLGYRSVRAFFTSSEFVDGALLQERFTAGLATNYNAGQLTGDDTHLHLAPGYEPGRRFHSAEVIRLSDAKKAHLGHTHQADARWRLYAFADAVDPRNPASRLNKLMDFLAGPNSPVAKYTPEDRARVFNDGRMESVRNCVDYRSGCRRALRRFGAITSNNVLLHRGLQDAEDDRALRWKCRERGYISIIQLLQCVAQTCAVLQQKIDGP